MLREMSWNSKQYSAEHGMQFSNHFRFSQPERLWLAKAVGTDCTGLAKRQSFGRDKAERTFGRVEAWTEARRGGCRASSLELNDLKSGLSFGLCSSGANNDR